MITTTSSTPIVLIRSASGDILVKEPSAEAALDAFIKAGGKPGYRVMIAAVDKKAHVDSSGRLVCHQRGPIWEARIEPGPKLKFTREVRP
jgi:hypothetical protein